jgi:hypothetical protein
VAKAPINSFQADWDKAVAWAQSEGVGQPAINAVYDLDAQRLANGDYPMSAAERNRELIAAQNPNAVTPNPSDNPQPSNVFNNAKRDLTMIGTGLEPQHLLGGLFDMAKNTVEGLMDPHRLSGPTLGQTVGNWLDDTALALVPGAADVGRVLEADPTLSGDAGAKALADDPLVSALDLIPGGKVAELFGGTEVAARIAQRAGLADGAQLGKGPVGLGLSILGNTKVGGKIGLSIDQAGQATLGKLGLSDALDSLTRNARGLGTSQTVADLAQDYSQSVAEGQSVESYIEYDWAQKLKRLNPAQQAKVTDILRTAQEKGIPLEVLTRQAGDPQVTEAIDSALDGPLRHQRDLNMAADLVTPVHSFADGKTHWYTTAQDQAVLDARKAASDAVQRALHGDSARPGEPSGLVGVERLTAADTRLSETTGPALAQLGQSIDQADQALSDPNLSLPGSPNLVKQGERASGKDRFLPAAVISKQSQIKVVLGMARNFQEALEDGNYDKVAEFGPQLRRRLSEWDFASADAKDFAPLMAVRDAVEKVTKIGRMRQQIEDKVTAEIAGQRKATVGELKEIRAAHDVARNTLKGRQQTERKALTDGFYYSNLQKIVSLRDTHLLKNDRLRAQYVELIRSRGDNAAVRATPAQLEAIMADVRRQEREILVKWRDSAKQINDRYGTEMDKARTIQKAELAQLDLRHTTEREALEDRMGAHTEMVGEVAKNLRALAREIRGFSKAVWDHPSDQWRDVALVAYDKALMAHDATQELIAETEAKFSKNASAERLADLRANPRILAEMVHLHFRQLRNDPNLPPDMAEMYDDLDRQFTKSALDQVHTLQVQDRLPPYIPAADPFDASTEGRVKGFSIPIGQGIPHVDAAAAKVWDMTPRTYEIGVAVHKGLDQILTRNATIEFAETHLVPRSVSADQVQAAVEQYFGVEKLDRTSANYQGFLDQVAREHFNLVRFDPQARFGFTLPRWEGRSMYMDAGMARALEKMYSQRGKRGLLGGVNNVFRYSVLGLSPRYTAHIIFGGGFMLAARSTPYMVKMLGDAWRGVKDGSLDPAIYRLGTPAEEGAMRFALNTHAHESGKSLAKIAAWDHIQTVQLVAGKANPIHWAKALADINYNFTSNVRHMMSAVAYLDGAAKAERRGTFLDPVSGQELSMTAERAAYEGMHHVYEVFGNLHRQTPLARSISQSILPFYGWTKHILQYALTMPIDHPFRAMVLSNLAYQDSNDVPLGLPQRIQFLFFFGAPDSQGNATAVDLRFLDPFRDIGTYGHLGGWIEGLNPVIQGVGAMVDPELTYGSNTLYPSLSYDPSYGIETAGLQGTLLSAVSQVIPQAGALGQAIDAATQSRTLLSTNPSAWRKDLFESLEIPFLNVGNVNVKQLAAHDEQARYEVAYQAAQNAFSAPGQQGTGVEQALNGYASVPDPLNPDYEVTPAQLQTVYDQALAQYPGLPPSESLISPPTPSGF